MTSCQWGQRGIGVRLGAQVLNELDTCLMEGLAKTNQHVRIVDDEPKRVTAKPVRRSFMPTTLSYSLPGWPLA